MLVARRTPFHALTLRLRSSSVLGLILKTLRHPFIVHLVPPLSSFLPLRGGETSLLVGWSRTVLSDTSHVTVCLRSLALLCVCVCVYRVLCAVYCAVADRVACPVSVHMHICIRIRVRIPYSHLATRHSPLLRVCLYLHTHTRTHAHTRSHTTRSICTLVAHPYIFLSFLSNVSDAALCTPEALARRIRESPSGRLRGGRSGALGFRRSCNLFANVVL